MYYVFFDTADLNFISRISNKYCPHIIRQLAQDYGLVKQSNGVHLDGDEKQEYFKDGMGKNLDFLDCFVLLGAYCSCKDCCEDHKCVLATDQIKCFGDVLEELKTEFLKDFRRTDPDDEKRAERLAFQEMCQKFKNNNNLNVEHIRISDKHLNNHNAYLRLYTKAAKRYKKINSTGFKYVQSDGKSDYAYFVKNVGLPNLTPCDIIRTVV